MVKLIPAVTAMGHTSPLIDHGAVWGLLSLEEPFRNSLGCFDQEDTGFDGDGSDLSSDENAIENDESGMEVVTGAREESSCEDRQSHRQAISHPGPIPPSPPLQICHNFSKDIHHFSFPLWCASRFLFEIFLSSWSWSQLLFW